MSATPTTRTVVRELLHRIGAGDPQKIAELYADGCDWRLDWPEEEHGRADTPWIRHRSTRADAAEHFRELAAHHVPEKAGTSVERILVDAEDAVVLGVIRQTAASTGRAYEARFALRLTVRYGWSYGTTCTRTASPCPARSRRRKAVRWSHDRPTGRTSGGRRTAPGRGIRPVSLPSHPLLRPDRADHRSGRT